MFEINADKRITFSDIRSHPVFKKFFPNQIDEVSQILYSKKIKIKDAKIPRNTVPQMKNTESENVDLRQSLAIYISNSEKYPKEKEFIYHKNSEIEFLYNNYKEFQ